MPNVYRLLSACTLLVVICMPGTAIGKKKDAPAEARPYVETSYLIAPRQVGDFELQGSSFDPGQKFDGAGFRYALKDHQETRVDIYVYPAGRMSPAEAIDSGIRDFRASMKYAAEHGTYSRLQELRDDPFPLDAADTRGSETPANDLDAQVIQAIAQAEQVSGRRLQMQLNLMPQDWPMYSNGYLFYKQLYYFKLRASAAQERISQEQFDALTDQAARTLIPALQVANVGIRVRAARNRAHWRWLPRSACTRATTAMARPRKPTYRRAVRTVRSWRFRSLPRNGSRDETSSARYCAPLYCLNCRNLP